MAASKDQLNKWEEVDNYFNQLFIPSDSVLEATLADSDAAGLPPANVAPNQGKFLHLLVKYFSLTYLPSLSPPFLFLFVFLFSLLLKDIKDIERASFVYPSIHSSTRFM